MSEAAQTSAADEQPALPIDGPQGDARDRSLNRDLRDLAAEARVLAEAEVAYQKARAVYAGGAAKGIAILLVAAFALVIFALVALVVGTLLALAPIVGEWAATAIVGGGLFVLALVCGLFAMARVSSAKTLLRDDRAADGAGR